MFTQIVVPLMGRISGWTFFSYIFFLCVGVGVNRRSELNELEFIQTSMGNIIPCNPSNEH